MKKYFLSPVDGRKSFYGKAVVIQNDDGSETLESYGTPVVRVESDGRVVRLWDDWSATTGRHVFAFVGLNKKAWDALPVDKQ